MRPEANETERLAVEHMLEFANLGKVTDVQAVYDIFFEPNMPKFMVLVERDGKTVWQPLYPQVGGVTAADLDTDRAHAQVMLEAFSRTKAAARKQYAGEISELVGKGVFAAVPRYDGRLSYELQFLTTGVEASAGFGLALLYDRQRPYGGALKRCALPSCDKWFLSFARGGGGPLPDYCTPTCRKAADKLRAVERARRWRRNQKRPAGRERR